MRARLLPLRDRGMRLSIAHVRDINDAPPGLLLVGMLDLSSIQQGARGKCLRLRDYQSAPGCGVMAVLYQPVLTGVENTFLKFRGFEPVDEGKDVRVVMQEWLVFPYAL